MYLGFCVGYKEGDCIGDKGNIRRAKNMHAVGVCKAEKGSDLQSRHIMYDGCECMSQE